MNFVEQMIEHIDCKNYAPNSFAPCQEAPASVAKLIWKKKIDKQEKEKDMSSYASVTNIAADTTEKDQRRYLENRLYDISSALKSGLRKQFGLVDDEAPKTPAEFIARIKDGKYTIDEDKLNKKSYDAYGALSYIRFRDPSVVEDQDGYDAAREALKAEVTKVTDIIKIKTPADGLAALQAFEGWTYKG